MSMESLKYYEDIRTFDAKLDAMNHPDEIDFEPDPEPKRAIVVDPPKYLYKHILQVGEIVTIIDEREDMIEIAEHERFLESQWFARCRFNIEEEL